MEDLFNKNCAVKSVYKNVIISFNFAEKILRQVKYILITLLTLKKSFVQTLTRKMIVTRRVTNYTT